MANKNFFVDGGNVQSQEGAIYLRRAADDQLLSLCRAGTFAYVLTARQMGKSSLMVNTAERLAPEGIRTVEIDLTGIGMKVTKEEWYLGILFEVRSQLGLRQDVTEWWYEPQRRGLSAAQRLLLFFEHVVLVEVSEPVIVFVDEIETTLRLDFTDDFFAAVRSVHNARSGGRFHRLSFVLIGAATPDSLIRDQRLTPFNIGQSVVLSDFTFEEALPLADGFGLAREDGRRVLRRILYWSGGHPYLTQRLCRAVAEERRDAWTEAEVDEVVARVFFDDQSDADKNLRFVREMLLTSELDRGGVLATYREILRGGRPVLDEEQALIKSHLKLSGVVKRQGSALRVRNPIYRQVFNESWVRSNTPINWARRLQRAASVAVALFFIALLPLALYAWAKKAQAEEALRNETGLRQELQRANAELEERNRQLRASTADEKKQRELAQTAAEREKVAKEEAEEKGTLAIKERDRARAAEQALAAERDRARSAEHRSFSSKLIAMDLSLRGAGSLPERVIVAREALRQSHKTEEEANHTMGDHALPPSAYQNLMDSAMLLPRSTAIPFTGTEVDRVMLMKGGQKLMGFDSRGRTLQTWDFQSHEISAREFAASERVPQDHSNLQEGLDSLERTYGLRSSFSPGTILQYRSDGKYLAETGQGKSVVIRELESGREFTVKAREAERSSPYPVVIFNPEADYALICPCVRYPVRGRILELWRIKDGQKVADIADLTGVLGVDFSRDGRAVYVVDNNTKLRVFDGETGEPVPETAKAKEPEKAEQQQQVETAAAGDSELSFDEEEAASAFSENRNFLVTVTPKVAQVWDLSDPRAVRKIGGVEAGTGRLSTDRSGLAVSNDGRLLTLLGPGKSTIDLWDVANKSSRDVVVNDAIEDTLFSPNGRNLITVSDNSLHVWDIHSKLEVYRIVDPVGFKTTSLRVNKPQGPVFSPDGNSLFTINRRGSARLWDLTANEDSVRKLIRLSGGDVSQGIEYLVAISQDYRTVQVWDPRAGRALASHTFEQDVSRATFSVDGEQVAVGTSDGETYTAWLWRWRDREAGALRALPIGAKHLDFISLSRGGKYLAVVIREGEDDKSKIRILNFGGGGGKQSWDLDTEQASHAKFISNTDHLLVVTKEGTLMWDILRDRPMGGLIGRNQKAADMTAYSAAGAYALVFSEDSKTINIAETATGAIVARLPHYEGVKAVDINYDGRLVVSAGRDGLIRVWERAEQRVINEVRYNGNSITISHDGKYIASINDSGSVSVWDISQPGPTREVARIHHGDGAGRVLFSPDARYVYTGKSPLYQVWRWQVNELVCEANRRLVKKELSPEEWLGGKYVLPSEMHFLNDKHRLSISCGTAPPGGQQ